MIPEIGELHKAIIVLICYFSQNIYTFWDFFMISMTLFEKAKRFLAPYQSNL